VRRALEDIDPARRESARTFVDRGRGDEA